MNAKVERVLVNISNSVVSLAAQGKPKIFIEPCNKGLSLNYFEYNAYLPAITTLRSQKAIKVYTPEQFTTLCGEVSERAHPLEAVPEHIKESIPQELEDVTEEIPEEIIEEIPEVKELPEKVIEKKSISVNKGRNRHKRNLVGKENSLI